MEKGWKAGKKRKERGGGGGGGGFGGCNFMLMLDICRAMLNFANASLAEFLKMPNTGANSTITFRPVRRLCSE